MKQLYSLTEAAEYLGIGRRSIEVYVRTGVLDVVILPSPEGSRGLRRIHRESLDELIDGNTKRARKAVRRTKPVQPTQHTNKPIILNLEHKEAS